jgi:hypothetical protein
VKGYVHGEREVGTARLRRGADAVGRGADGGVGGRCARVSRVVYGASIADAVAFGFRQLAIPAVDLVRLGRSPLCVDAGPRRQECLGLFEEWRTSRTARTSDA